MTSRLFFLPLFAFGTLASAGVPTPVKLLWPQVAFTPPGTNAVRRTDVVGGAIAVPVGTPTGGTPAGAVGVAPGGVPLPSGVPVPPGATAGGAPGRPGKPGAAAGGTSSGGGAPTTTAPQVAGPELDGPLCTVSVIGDEFPVSAFGGIVEVRVQLKPAGCRPVLGSSGNWLLLAAGPQGGNVYRFSVSPNLSGSPRTGVIVIGGQKVLIRQAAGGGARFAATPGHITLSVRDDKAPSPRLITLFSEDKNLTYTVVPVQPWLQVTPVAKNNAPGTHRYQITINPARLRSGRNEGAVQVTVTGQPGPPLVIPVVVEVPRVR